MYAWPSPSLAVRCSTCSQSRRSASSSATAPVPSGEPSSTTRASPSNGAWRRTSSRALIIRGRFSRSLYVGSTITYRSAIRQSISAAEKGAPYHQAVPPAKTNAEIAERLELMGDLLELEGAVVYRVLAYRRAARSIRETPDSAARLSEQGRLTGLPAVGDTVAAKVAELLGSGHIQALDK